MITPEIHTLLCNLKIETIKLEQHTQTFEEEIIVNSIGYALEQAKLVFKNRKEKE